MSVYRDNDGSYKTYADTSRGFEYEHQAYEHEKYIYGNSQQPTDHSFGGAGGDVSISLEDLKVSIKFLAPVLILYWLIAFPALNASWLLQNSSAPFNWIGTVLYTPWEFLVKAAGAPYYLAYLFGDTGAIFAMPVIAVVWLVLLSVIAGRLRENHPKLVKKVFYMLAIAAAVPVVLVVVAYLFGAIRGDSIAYFWYGHDPYTSYLWQFLHRGSTRFYF
jgi:hypothetical protein